jgi:hypothetical protein
LRRRAATTSCGTGHSAIHRDGWEHSAAFAVDTVECLGRSLPNAQQRLVEAWAEIHLRLSAT